MLTNRVLPALVTALLTSATAPEPVRVSAADGFALEARFYAAPDGGRGVLLLHQCDREGPATGYEALAPRLQALGLSALVLDLRGYGGSVSEQFSKDAWRENQKHFATDVAAAFDYLLARTETRDDAAAVVGASCGGREAVRLADQRPNVSSLVLISSALRRDSALVDTIAEWLAARLDDGPRVGSFVAEGRVQAPGDGGDLLFGEWANSRSLPAPPREQKRGHSPFPVCVC